MITGEIRCENVIVLPLVRRTENWRERMRGLLGADERVRCRGMLLTPCNSIHTMLMPVDLDVFFLDRNNKIIKSVIGLAPWRMAGSVRAAAVLEVQNGILDPSGLIPGTTLVWNPYF